eukprot:NODE_283_length_2492_cov_27.446089_g262_i0.p1 GENE.NODE_283_length_2492_cov_27.446089_g262_i0~~NODE_283_length_2492_cov_27.446089_g262_i0.p1  ORF type:complete len:802 (+),score=245.51 NODE_283_length_2492_cov_27.446089_g262_i0:76-2406(+)
MQRLRYALEPALPLPAASVLPKQAGNNFNDPAFQIHHHLAHTLDPTKAQRNRPVERKANPHPTGNVAVLEACLKQTKPCDIDPTKWITLDDKIFHYSGFFRESIAESEETEHLRKVSISFYPCDGTIMVVEHRIPNSGFQGGTLIKRQKVPLGADNINRSQAMGRQPSSDFITINDLNVGVDVTMYGKTFHIVDCDHATRDFMEELGISVGAPERFPDDVYFSMNRSLKDKMIARRHLNWEDIELKMSMEQQVKGRSVMHYPEEIMKTQKFLQDDGKVLSFSAVWDDRHNPNGDLRRFGLQYYLGDDTIEIVEEQRANSGRDHSRAFAYRRRLPKDKTVDMATFNLTFTAQRGGQNDPSKFFSPDDLAIGANIPVYGRVLRLVDCNQYTRNYYLQTKGVDLGPPIDVEAEYGLRPKSPPAHVPPHHNGYGTEEDALGNWKSLVLKQPAIDLQKWMKLDGQELRFSAKFSQPQTTEDSERTFLITFFLGDDTIQVTEHAARNSGFMGGRFLKRMKVKKYRGEGPNSFLHWTDFYTGSEVNLNSHLFLITGLDDVACRFRYRKENLSNAITSDNIIHMLHYRQEAHPEDLKQVTIADFVDFFEREGISPNDQSAEAEILTAMRQFDADYKGNRRVYQFIQTMEGDPISMLEETTGAAEETAEQHAAKHLRRQKLVASSAIHRFKQALNGRSLQLADAFRVIAAYPRSPADAGNHSSNAMNGQINPFQLRTAFKKFNVELSGDEMQAVLAELIPSKQLFLTDFIAKMKSMDDLRGLPPL